MIFNPLKEFAINSFLYIFLSYILGNILFSFWFGKIFKNIDITKKGSKNPGARNAFRVLGPFLGVTVGILDILKGFVPVFLAYKLGFQWPIIYLAGCAAMLGHVYPVFHRFKGGLGMAVAIGFLIGLVVINYFEPLKYSPFVGISLAIFSAGVIIWADRVNSQHGFV